MKPFIIGEAMKDIVVKCGQTFTWDIKYGGEPEPEVCWHYNGTPISAEERYFMDYYASFLNKTCHFTIENW